MYQTLTGMARGLGRTAGAAGSFTITQGERQERQGWTTYSECSSNTKHTVAMSYGNFLWFWGFVLRSWWGESEGILKCCEERLVWDWLRWGTGFHCLGWRWDPALEPGLSCQAQAWLSYKDWQKCDSCCLSQEWLGWSLEDPTSPILPCSQLLFLSLLPSYSNDNPTPDCWP